MFFLESSEFPYATLPCTSTLLFNVLLMVYSLTLAHVRKAFSYLASFVSVWTVTRLALGMIFVDRWPWSVWLWMVKSKLFRDGCVTQHQQLLFGEISFVCAMIHFHKHVFVKTDFDRSLLLKLSRPPIHTWLSSYWLKTHDFNFTLKFLANPKDSYNFGTHICVILDHFPQ